MFLIDRIIPKYFFVALFLGLLFSYFNSPEPTIIIKYPTPFNAGKITYKDNAGVCYKYEMEKVSCPAENKGVTTVKFQ